MLATPDQHIGTFGQEIKRLFAESAEPGLFNNRFRSWLAPRARSNLNRWASFLALTHKLDFEFATHGFCIALERGERGRMLARRLQTRNRAFGRTHT